MAIWVIKGGQREGPYEEQDVRELVYEGTYTDSDLAIRDGQFDWSTLGQVLNRVAATEPVPEPEPGSSTEASPPTVPPLPPEPPPFPTPAAEEPPEIPAGTPPPVPRGPPRAPGPMQVSVVDFQMPFGSMVILMVKWALASIPALLIVGAIAAMFWTAFFALVAAVVHH